MKIGVLSDSHGKVKRLEAAMGKLESYGVHAIVHCGDIGSPECLELLVSAGVPAYAVPGNMDRDVDQLEAAAERLGVIFSRRCVEVPIGPDKLLVVTHGDDRALIKELIESGNFAYVCHGHTHRTRNQKRGNVRVVNPGALRRPLSSWRSTVAIIDTEADTVGYFRI